MSCISKCYGFENIWHTQQITHASNFLRKMSQCKSHLRRQYKGRRVKVMQTGTDKTRYEVLTYSLFFLQSNISNWSQSWCSRQWSILEMVSLSVSSPNIKAHLHDLCITSARLQPDILQNASLQYTIGNSTICAFANRKLLSAKKEE